MAIVVAALCLSACSAAIMATAPTRSSLLHHASTRADIRSAFGAPIAVEVFPVLTPIPNRERGNETVMLGAVGSPGVDPSNGPQLLAESVETYLYAGLVTNDHDSGEFAALAGYTAGLSEIVATPYALKQRIAGGGSKSQVKVWYSGEGIALAYLWEEADVRNNPN